MRRLELVLGHVSPSREAAAAAAMEVPLVPLVSRAEELGPAFARLRETFLSGKTRKYGWRRQQLQALHAALVAHRSELVAAVMRDFGKRHPFENTVTLALATAEVAELLRHFQEWAAPQRVRSSLAQWPARSEVRHEPKGVVLLVSPWNYPLNLALVPLAGAIAAGNAAFVKLSRHSPHASQCLAALLRRVLDPEAFCIDWQGGADFLTALLAQRYDHVMFTGSVEVGKVVAAAAARQLASTTLELGGKNPVVVAADANIDLAAKRVVWGKCYNAGQTCIAPDYVLLVRGEGRTEAFAAAFRAYVRQFFGENPQQSASYSRIIHAAAFRRLAGLLGEGRVLAGGQTDAADLYIAPTLVQVSLEEAGRLELMRAEIFGPILPLIEVESLAEAVRFLQGRDLPLALHAFSRSQQTLRELFAQTRSGSANGNEAALMVFANGRLPFGGVGASGLGSYHGERTFRAFSNERATVYASPSSLLDHAVHVFVYPPYRDWSTTLAEWLIWSGL